MILPKQNKNKVGTFNVGLVGFLGGRMSEEECQYELDG